MSRVAWLRLHTKLGSRPKYPPTKSFVGRVAENLEELVYEETPPIDQGQVIFAVDELAHFPA